MTTPSTDRDIGRLEAKVDLLIADVTAIRSEMVTRREFEATASEHVTFRNDIATLKELSHRSAYLRTFGEKVLWSLVGMALLYIGVQV